jgi:hypothetical protein
MCGRIGMALENRVHLAPASCYDSGKVHTESENKMSPNSLTRILLVASLLALVGCSNSGTTSDTTTSSPSGNSASTGGSASSSQKPAAPLFAPKPIVVDAGTTIEVTVDQAVSSKTANPGDHFEASLSAPVMVGDKQVIPSGAKAVGKVTDAKSAGRFKGNAAITVALDSVTVKGTSYPVQTSSVTEAGKGRGKRTAVGAGGGAAVGAIIGAIAGGGKGAAIGAGAGAGAGTAGAAVTGDRDVQINAETKLSFKLKEPLEIKGN